MSEGQKSRRSRRSWVALCSLGAKAQGDGVSPASTRTRNQLESELIFEGLGSFGLFHVFAYPGGAISKWAGLNTTATRGDRFIGAGRDYVAEILAVAILRQPSKTDVFGDP